MECFTLTLCLSVFANSALKEFFLDPWPANRVRCYQENHGALVCGLEHKPRTFILDPDFSLIMSFSLGIIF